MPGCVVGLDKWGRHYIRQMGYHVDLWERSHLFLLFNIIIDGTFQEGIFCLFIIIGGGISGSRYRHFLIKRKQYTKLVYSFDCKSITTKIAHY